MLSKGTICHQYIEIQRKNRFSTPDPSSSVKQWVASSGVKSADWKSANKAFAKPHWLHLLTQSLPADIAQHCTNTTAHEENNTLLLFMTFDPED